MNEHLNQSSQCMLNTANNHIPAAQPPQDSEKVTVVSLSFRVFIIREMDEPNSQGFCKDYRVPGKQQMQATSGEKNPVVRLSCGIVMRKKKRFHHSLYHSLECKKSVTFYNTGWQGCGGETEPLRTAGDGTGAATVEKSAEHPQGLNTDLLSGPTCQHTCKRTERGT